MASRELSARIHDDLIDAASIGEDERKLGREVACRWRYVRADQTAKHADRLFDDVIQLQGPAVGSFVCGCRQKLVGEGRGAHGRLLDLPKMRGEFLVEFRLPVLHHRRVSRITVSMLLKS